MDILLTYDIADTQGEGAARLRQVARVCEKYGERVQFSVFECRLSPSQFARFIGEIQDAIDNRRDSVNVYRFSGKISDARLTLGRCGSRELGDPWVI